MTSRWAGTAAVVLGDSLREYRLRLLIYGRLSDLFLVCRTQGWDPVTGVGTPNLSKLLPLALLLP